MASATASALVDDLIARLRAVRHPLSCIVAAQITALNYGMHSSHTDGSLLISCHDLASALALLLYPVFFDNLARSANGESIRGHIIGHARSRGNVRTFAYSQRRNQGRIASDEDVIFDDGNVLLRAIVVTSDGSRSNVHVLADFRVSQIGQVVGLRAFSKPDLFSLHEVSHMRPLADLATWPKMRIRAQNRVSLDSGFLQNASLSNENAVRNIRVLNNGIRPNAALPADTRPAAYLHEGLDRGISADLYVSINCAGVGIEDGHTFCHQPLRLSTTHSKVD